MTEAVGLDPWEARRREALREEEELFASEGRHLAPVGAIDDELVDVEGGEIRARIYTPEGDGPFPGIVHFHGGGFVLFSIDWSVSVDWCRDVCSRVGAVVVDVDYRLAPEHPYPTPVEDCYRALEWVVENADRLRIRPAALVVAGESAGANLAAAVALLARDRSGPALRGQLLEVPAVELLDGDDHPSALAHAGGFDLTLADTHEFHDAYLSTPLDGAEPTASPLRADPARLPPTAILTAAHDVLRDTGELFARRLQRAGVPTLLRRHRACLHGTKNRPRDHDAPRLWQDDVVAALEMFLSETAVARVRAEHLEDPFGIGVAAPRLTWLVESAKPGWEQTAYEIAAEERTVRVESDESVLVPWPFAPLASRQRVELRVRVRDHDGAWSPWSAPCVVEAGLLEPADWTASFVAPTWDEDPGTDQPAAYLERRFEIVKPVARARLYASALGVYEAQLNGSGVSDDVLAPGWTSYDHRLRYQTYDVTMLVRPGANVLGAVLGDGWFRGKLGFRPQRNLYGERTALLAQLEIEYEDGSRETVASDESWRAARGPILASSLYDGEWHDARLEPDDWSPVRLLERQLDTLVAPLGPPVRRTEIVAPAGILRSPSGRTIVDFGQNLVGRVRISVSGPAGTTVTIRHAEVLEDGELCVRPLRRAAATDVYVLAGAGRETWEPRFTFHGFRYAEIDGWPGELEPGDIRAVVLQSDLERTGWFDCSDPLVARLHENVVWSMRGNFVDLPTDCPQRDERLAWTGDIQVFAPTACFLHDSVGFLASWLEDVTAEQRERGGRVPNVVPDVLPRRDDGAKHDWHAPAAGWGDAAAVVPWVVYERTGDLGLLERQFESMRDWVDYVDRLVGDSHLWDTGFQFGDWLDPTAPPDHPDRAVTDRGLVATAYFARSAGLVAGAAQLLGRVAEAERFARLAQGVRDAFAARYVGSDGRMVSDSQTAYALALAFDLLPDVEARTVAGWRLEELVRGNGYRIGTGFLGTPVVCDALCAAGAFETAFRLLAERACPSWLYPVTMGATTIWERWDSMRPDGSINPGEMTSFNHYAFGAVADWLHRVVAGLAPLEPGYRRFAVAPVPAAWLDHASARHRTPYGIASVGWRRNDGALLVEAVVPPNAHALVSLPDGRPAFEIGSGSHAWLCRADGG